MRFDAGERAAKGSVPSPGAGALWEVLRAHAGPRCRRCGRGYPIAPACFAACIVPIPADACPRCRHPAAGGRCGSLGCVNGWWSVERVDVILGYKCGDVDRLIIAAKRLEPWAIVALGRVLAGWFSETAGERRYDIVLPVPFHPRRRTGGVVPYAPAAHALTAIYLDARPAIWPAVPADDLCPPLLVHTCPRPPRRSQSEAARWRAIRGAFALAFPTRLFGGARALIVDDVMTSGATINECARVLIEDGGASAVGAVVLARQPWRPAGRRQI